jgi:hypothetical protein
LKDLLVEFQYVYRLPAKFANIVIVYLDLLFPPNWRKFASTVFPEFSAMNFEIYFKEEMKSVLHLWSLKKGATIAKLINILDNLQQEDVLIRLNHFANTYYGRIIQINPNIRKWNLKSAVELTVLKTTMLSYYGRDYLEEYANM